MAIFMLIWKTQTLNVNTASLRYRCVLPLRYLNRVGVTQRIYGGTDRVPLTAKTQAIVFVKSFRDEDVILCERAVQMGVPVILDLCDNIFIKEYAAGNNTYVPAKNFLKMAQRATAIVTTGEALQAEIKEALTEPSEWQSAPLHKVPLFIIPDGSETLGDIDYAFQLTRWKRLWNWLRQRMMKPLKVSKQKIKKTAQQIKIAKQWLKGQIQSYDENCNESFAQNCGEIEKRPAEVKIQSSDQPNGQPSQTVSQPTPLIPDRWHTANPNVKTVLWFGNHGAKYGNFGMLDILEVAEALNELSQALPLRLIVVSNSHHKYNQHIAPLPFETSYLRWHPRAIYDYIRRSDVVIVPNSQSAFSICKSANRAVLSLSQGTPVVASRTPTLAMFEQCVVMDDWALGLRQYLLDPQKGVADVASAQQIIAENLSGEAIARQWLTVLKSVSKPVQVID